MVPTVDHMGISWNIMQYHTPKETPETTLAPIMAYLCLSSLWVQKMIKQNADVTGEMHHRSCCFDRKFHG